MCFAQSKDRLHVTDGDQKTASGGRHGTKLLVQLWDAGRIDLAELGLDLTSVVEEFAQKIRREQLAIRFAELVVIVDVDSASHRDRRWP